MSNKYLFLYSGSGRSGWLKLDDKYVSELRPWKIITPFAYILIYATTDQEKKCGVVGFKT